MATRSVWRKVLYGLEIVGVVLVVGVVGLAIYVAGTWDRVWDDVPIPNVQASTDPEVIKRGEYFVYGPSHCVECHAGTWAAFQKVIDGEQVPLRGGSRFRQRLSGQSTREISRPIPKPASAVIPTGSWRA